MVVSGSLEGEKGVEELLTAAQTSEHNLPKINAEDSSSRVAGIESGDSIVLAQRNVPGLFAPV